MKKRLLSNGVRNTILMAILLQSTIFGIGLVITGTFSGTTNRPYKVMESQMAERNSLLSSYMSNVLLLANIMGKELAKMTGEVEIQNRLVDNLNHTSSSGGIFYVDLDGREALVLHDGEPDIYSSTYGGISCIIGRTQSSYPIALSKDWRLKLTDQEWGIVEQFWENRGNGGTWFFTNECLYYMLSQESGRGGRIMGLEISSDVLDSCLKLDSPPYQGMTMLLLSDRPVHFGLDQTFEGTGCDLEEKTGYISLANGGIGCDDVRSALQTYGYMYSRAVYVIAVCHHSELATPSQSTILMVTGVCLLSIFIAVIFSYIAIYMVLKSIQQLQEDITYQKPEEVHFRESGIVKTDRTRQALNDVADRLEQSYSRYSFTMRSTGDNVGSFEYQGEGGRIKVSPSVRILLSIPADNKEPANGVDYNKRSRILDSLEQIEELEDGCASTDIYGDRRAATIRQRREEHGVFGLVIDKTDTYNEIVRLGNISQHDQLTGLYDSSYLKKEGQKILDENVNRVNALVLRNLGNLKYISDNFGHETGDRYLKAMANLLTSMTQGERCIAVRLSGNEFMLFFCGYDNRNVIGQKVWDGYAGRPSLRLPDGTGHGIDASIGLAYAQREMKSVDGLLNRADRAMYQVRHGEKNGMAIHDKSDEAGPV